MSFGKTGEGSRSLPNSRTVLSRGQRAVDCLGLTASSQSALLSVIVSKICSPSLDMMPKGHEWPSSIYFKNFPLGPCDCNILNSIHMVDLENIHKKEHKADLEQGNIRQVMIRRCWAGLCPRTFTPLSQTDYSWERFSDSNYKMLWQIRELNHWVHLPCTPLTVFCPLTIYS